MVETRTRPHPHKPQEGEAAKKKAAEAAAAERLQEVTDVRDQMGTPSGRRNAYRMLERAGAVYGDAQVEDELFNPNSMTMARGVGARGVAWRFDHLCRLHCNDLWLLMLQEHEAALKNQ